MKIVIAPDSFKGTLAAVEVAQAIAEGVQRFFPQAKMTLLPMADGGEGTLDAILFAIQGRRCCATVSDACGRPTQVAYGILPGKEGDTAVIEAAQIVGLALAGDSDVMQRSTRGVGELILHCLGQDIRRFMIGVGGSSTNDGGAGLLAALGVVFLDGADKKILPTPEGLAHLQRLDFSALDRRLEECNITLLSDVDYPLCGTSGATAIFGPQKGVAENQIARLDADIARYAQLADAWHGETLAIRPGAGAAGGLGYALMLLGANRRAGAEVVCELMQLDAALRDADYVITGEGKSDAQTLHGKLPLVVARHAQAAKVKVILLSAVIDEASRSELEKEFSACYAVVGETIPVERALRETAVCVRARAQQLAQEILK